MRALLAAILLTWLAIGARGAEPATTPGRLRVGVVQMALGQTIADNRNRIVSWIAKAAARGVRVVVFPEGALRGKDGDKPAIVDEAVKVIRRAAGDQRVYVLCGGASYSPKTKRDVCWMFVAGPDGREVFRYDKLYDKHDAKMPGMFHIDGVPCGTMICADRWLRGVEEIPIQQGAQISFELSCNFASEWVAPFQWYWYVPRALRNNVWDDLGDMEERRAEVRGLPRPRSGPVEVYSPFSANLVVRAGVGPQLITATRHVGPKNQDHPRRTSQFNPQMDAWYRLGAAIIGPK
jgi:hypothetical protein